MLETPSSNAAALESAATQDYVLSPLVAPAANVYRRPSRAILEAQHAPIPPIVTLSPTREYLLLLETMRYPSIAELAQPSLRLAGLRINPRTNGTHRGARFTSFRLKRIDEEGEVVPLLPHGSRLGYPLWSPNGERFAFTNTRDNGVELWICEAATGHIHKLDGIRLNAAYGSPVEWMPDSCTLLVRLVPKNRACAPPVAPSVPPGPNTQESSGKRSPITTYQDLLRSPHDEDLFDYYTTSQLGFVDVEAGELEILGTPAIFRMVELSPDGEHLLVSRVCRPYSYLHPHSAFPTEVEVWNTEGRVVRHLASIPLADEIALDGVMTGRREHRWHPTEAATLLWVEALDGGDPKREVKDRDRVMMWRAPFAKSPIEIARTENRFAGLRWTETGDFALVSDYDCDRRWRRTMLVSFGEGGAGRPRTLFSHSAQDWYKHPGTPVSRALSSGHYAVLQRGDWIYLSGGGESAEGSRPFLDRLNLRTLQSQRLFRSDDGSYETFVALLDDDAARFITCRESSVEPPNYFVRERTVKFKRSRGSKVTKALTRFHDSASQLRAIQKRLVTYERADGVKLSFTLYLPPGYRDGTRLPTVFWSYPVEFNDPATAGQVIGSTNRFTYIRGTSHLFFLLEGYAVLDQVAMPVIGDAETRNETFVEQITMNAGAAIVKATEIGVADPQRIGCGGHSYGAFMTANLLAHTNLFRAGIALSGAYNRTLTPFGFQVERRTLWEARETYARVSPLLHADRITAPLLLIHGEADENPGTHPLQSERMYQAIRGNGGSARLVTLPHEGHCYAARESVEHVLYEMTAWFRQHLSVPSINAQSS